MGFDRELRGWLLTDRVPPKSKAVPHPVLEEYNRLAMTLGCEDPGTQMRLGVTAEDLARLERFWTKQPQGLRERGVVVFNSGGAFGPAKNWPRESFANLARKVVDELGQTVLVVCGPAERDEARWIATQARRPNVLTLADEPLSVGLTKAAIRAADLLVTTDSGPRHFAAPFGVPTVTLYGPTHIAWSDTHDPRAIALQIAVDCGPCQQRACPQGHHRCMRELSVDLVFDAVRRQLEPVTRRVA